MPTQICTDCMFEANNAYFFKQKCEQSDKLLRNSLQTPVGFLATNVKQEEEISVSHLTNDDFIELFPQEYTTSPKPAQLEYKLGFIFSVNLTFLRPNQTQPPRTILLIQIKLINSPPTLFPH